MACGWGGKDTCRVGKKGAGYRQHARALQSRGEQGAEHDPQSYPRSRQRRFHQPKCEGFNLFPHVQQSGRGACDRDTPWLDDCVSDDAWQLAAVRSGRDAEENMGLYRPLTQ